MKRATYEDAVKVMAKQVGANVSTEALIEDSRVKLCAEIFETDGFQVVSDVWRESRRTVAGAESKDTAKQPVKRKAAPVSEPAPEPAISTTEDNF